MNDLVVLINGEALTNSLALANGTDNDHASILKLVRNYQSDIEEFGGVGFEIQSFETQGGVKNLGDFQEFGPLGFEIQKGAPLQQGGFAKPTEYATLNAAGVAA